MQKVTHTSLCDAPIQFDTKKMLLGLKAVLLIKKIVNRSEEGYFCVMTESIQKQKVFITGGIVTVGLTIVLSALGFIFTGEEQAYFNVYILILYWLLVSFLIYKIRIYKTIGFVALFVALMILDNYMRIPDNPITLSAIVLYWITAVYLLFPRFFKKYKIIILSVYGVVLSYFIISRMMPNYQEDHHLRVINLLVIPIPFLVAMGIYDQWHWLTVLQADKAKTELTLLKSQINPHFFFNTLNNLYGLAMEKSDEAPRVILRLSDMMRYTIYKGKEETVSLKDEIDYLQNYIELHKIRYQKEVEVSFVHDVEEHLQVAPLLFIIPLENAFKHGVEKMREGAFIHLQMHTRDDQLIFAIENSYEKAPSHQPRGIGLDNLQKRLQHSYPNRHELIIDQEESIYKFQLTLVLT